MGWRVRGERERRAQRWSLVYVTAITEAEEGRKERRRRGTADFMKSKYRRDALAGRELHPFPSYPPCFFRPSPLQYSYALNILMRREICKPCVTGNRAILSPSWSGARLGVAVPGCAILVKCVSGPMCDSDIKQQPSLHLRFPSTSIRVSTYRALSPGFLLHLFLPPRAVIDCLPVALFTLTNS